MKALVRPSNAEISQIQDTLEAADLAPRLRKRLRAVLRWARGATFKEAAREVGIALKTTQKAIHDYRSLGLVAFTKPISRPAGRPRIAAELVAAVVDDLRTSIMAGQPISYRKLAAKHQISLGQIATIAKTARLDAKNRRAPITRPTQLPDAPPPPPSA